MVPPLELELGFCSEELGAGTMGQEALAMGLVDCWMARRVLWWLVLRMVLELVLVSFQVPGLVLVGLQAVVGARAGLGAAAPCEEI